MQGCVLVFDSVISSCTLIVFTYVITRKNLNFQICDENIGTRAGVITVMMVIANK